MNCWNCALYVFSWPLQANSLSVGTRRSHCCKRFQSCWYVWWVACSRKEAWSCIGHLWCGCHCCRYLLPMLCRKYHRIAFHLMYMLFMISAFRFRCSWLAAVVVLTACDQLVLVLKEVTSVYPGAFTTNIVSAAPVVYCKRALDRSTTVWRSMSWTLIFHRLIFLNKI